jgi:two-component system sensor histidine kinase UhpB
VARDLHDEVGPYLFAIKVDAGDIPRLALEGAATAIGARATAITEAADHIHGHVKAILRQLRPSHALELGLRAAIEGLVAFWRQRRPEVRFEVQIAPDLAIADRGIEDAAYRLAQESISNAVRHGRPSVIAVSVAATPTGQILVSITDDGGGFHQASSRDGLGLAGMAERVRALDGRFEVTNSADDLGVRVSALLPNRCDQRAVVEAAG